MIEACRTKCAEIIRQLGERISLACRWLWAVGQTLHELDDQRERREIAETGQAIQRHLALLRLAAADGEIDAGELAQMQISAGLILREHQDVVAYNEREDRLHDQARRDTERCRATLAPASRALDRAQAAGSTARGGVQEPPWQTVRDELEARAR